MALVFALIFAAMALYAVTLAVANRGANDAAVIVFLLGACALALVVLIVRGD